MRLFTALDPSPEVHESLTQLLRRLQPTARLRWTKPENLHLTLKFIGEWPEDRLEELKQALASIPAPSAGFDVKFSGDGIFPKTRTPRVFWVGIEPSAELRQLAADMDRVLGTLGIAPEKRAFSPHLTLARIQERTSLGPLHREIESLLSLEFGAFHAECFYLYQSQLRPGGSIYTRIGEFPWKLGPGPD